MRKLLFIVLGAALCLTVGVGGALAQSSDVNVAVGGIGDLGLGSLYDVRDVGSRTPAWQNYLVVENTTGAWVAFHLRFRAWRKSIEVYDHIILLSPYDVFWAIIEQARVSGMTSGGEAFQPGDVLISSADTETLLNSGLIFPDDLVNGQGFWLEMFQYFLLTDCGFGNPAIAEERAVLQGELQAGHFEIIGLWQLEVPTAYKGEDTHVLANVVRDLWIDSTNTINVFDVMEALFFERGPAGQLHYPGWACDIVRISGFGPPSADDDNETGLDGYTRLGLDCGNVLTGTMEMYDTGTGVYQLENLVFLEDFRTGWYDSVNGFWWSWYAHRDGFAGGAIVFPVDVMFWVVDYYADGLYRHPAFYVNENWATTVGPGLRDGDDGDLCFNDSTVPDFNNHWSLDELEIALAKYEIWYQWFAIAETFDGAEVTTSVVLTYPTKHYHYFWRDWPYYNGQLFTAQAVNCYSYSQIPCGAPANWGAYFLHCAGSSQDRPNWDPSNVFSSEQAYVAAVNAYRGADAEPSIDTTGQGDGCKDSAHGSIAVWFQAKWKNGPIITQPRMWDMDENRESSTPGSPPPGSPWKPEFQNPKTIPHEVNIIIVGGGVRTGIEEATGILDEAPVDWGYTSGHFVIPVQYLTNGTRDSAAGSSYLLPPIGLVIFTHSYGVDVDGITRAAMAEWHYKSYPMGLIAVGDE